jgi:hypothetical protein
MRKPDLPPSYDVRIGPTHRAIEDGPSGGSGPDYWVIEGAPLGPMLATLYDMPETRIDLSPPLDTSRYDLVLVLPRNESQETMIRLMREGIEKYHGPAHGPFRGAVQSRGSHAQGRNTIPEGRLRKSRLNRPSL